MTNPHWEQFSAAVPWFLDEGQVAEVRGSAPPGTWTLTSADFARLFPQVQRLLQGAFVTPLQVTGTRYQLFSWALADGEDCAWLSPSPSADPPSGLHPDHRTLLESFGGIVERSNEPMWWILNHNEVLTEREARYDGTFIRDYASAFEEERIPIEMEQFYSIAREANGNTTLGHRVSGAVILFAPDHSFDYVQPLAGCPEYTLYRIPGAPTFREWVDRVARQWHDGIEGRQAR